DTMGEMIDVVAGEELALSKNTVDGDNTWRISFYDSGHNYVTRATTSTNQYILTVPEGATKMWVSYPTGSKPQIVRGTDFIPYRPNLADQMTTEEINIFRNEYDEFADRTERRLTAVDSSGGRLDVAENLITQNANGLTLKADQSTVDTLAGTVQSLGTEFDIVAGQVSSRVWNTDIDSAIDGIEVGGRNSIRNSNSFNFTPRGGMNIIVDNDADLVVEEWGATNATKIRLVNGLNSTDLLKATLHDYSYNPYVVGETYTFSFYIRNDRDANVPIIIHLNAFTDYEPVRIEGGESKKVVITAKKNDNNFPQVRFMAQRIVNNLEFTIWG